MLQHQFIREKIWDSFSVWLGQLNHTLCLGIAFALTKSEYVERNSIHFRKEKKETLSTGTAANFCVR